MSERSNRTSRWVADPDTPVDERWNHNIALHPLLLGAVPDPCPRALDAGCGDGVLTWQLADRAGQVVAVDLDEGAVDRTRDVVAGRENVEVRRLDLMDPDALEEASFDAVLSIATLHHLDLRAGLTRLAALVAPGGVLAVGGLARSRSGYDLAFDATGFVSTRVNWVRRGGVWLVQAPIQDPKETYTQVLEQATMLLPGVRYRRHALFRYSLVWTRPSGWEP